MYRRFNDCTTDSFTRSLPYQTHPITSVWPLTGVLRRLQGLQETLSDNPYASVDPTPPADERAQPSLEQLRAALLDDSLPLFQRYRAMFSLRNRGDADSVTALADGRWHQRSSARGGRTLCRGVGFVRGAEMYDSALFRGAM